MRASLAAVTAVFIGAAALAPQGAEAQRHKAGVQERVEQERARAERGSPEAARDRGAARDRSSRGARGARAQSCAPGHDVARGTPAGPVLDRVFGPGGQAAHARPGCRGQGKERGARTQDRTRDATGTVWDRVRDEAARAERAERRRGG